MLISGVLDVAIGMIFVYLILSLITSAANEVIEMKLKNRATDLEKGLRELLDPGKKAGDSTLIQQVYDHPLVNGLFEGTFEESRIKEKAARIKGLLKSTALPSYIPSKNFAMALMDLALRGNVETPGKTNESASDEAAEPPANPPVPPANVNSEFSIEELRAALTKESVIPANTRRALLALIDTAENDINKARQEIESWFNSSMDRVSGWYKKRSQIIVVVLGFIVAFAVNADSVLIAKRLVADKSLRATIASAATEYAKANANASPTPATEVAGDSSKKNDAKKDESKSVPPSGAASPSPSTKPSPSPSVTEAANSSSPKPSVTTTPADKKQETASATAPPPPKCYPVPACEKDAASPQCKLDKSLCDIEALGLPIGWNYQDDPLRRWPGLNFSTTDGWLAQFYWHFLGWLITALAISLGAPFWFDVLNKFIIVRSTVKPKEKSGDEKPK